MKSVSKYSLAVFGIFIFMVLGCDKFDTHSDPDAKIIVNGNTYSNSEIKIKRQYSVYNILDGNYTRIIFEGSINDDLLKLILYIKGTQQMPNAKGTLIWLAHSTFSHSAELSINDNLLYGSIENSGYTSINSYDAISAGTKIKGSFSGYLINYQNNSDTIRVQCDDFQSTTE